jgi:hypothetical protein
MAKYVFLVPAILLVGCSSMNERLLTASEVEYERVDNLLEARDQFRLKEISCKKAGGYIWISKIGYYPTLYDYRSAKCVQGR